VQKKNFSRSENKRVGETQKAASTIAKALTVIVAPFQGLILLLRQTIEAGIERNCREGERQQLFDCFPATKDHKICSTAGKGKKWEEMRIKYLQRDSKESKGNPNMRLVNIFQLHRRFFSFLAFAFRRQRGSSAFHINANRLKIYYTRVLCRVLIVRRWLEREIC
jgi:hypothetical protein